MLTQERLKELLHYDPETGVWTWRKAKGGVPAGRQAGSINNRGYILIHIDGKNYRAHRLAFIYMTGQCPKEVDHINKVRVDNRWANLREASSSENKANSNVRQGRSGVKGVHWVERLRKWRAQIKVNKRRKHLGCYSCLQEAADAYDAAAREHFKEFAVTNETLGTMSSFDERNVPLVPQSSPLEADIAGMGA